MKKKILFLPLYSFFLLSLFLSAGLLFGRTSKATSYTLAKNDACGQATNNFRLRNETSYNRKYALAFTNRTGQTWHYDSITFTAGLLSGGTASPFIVRLYTGSSAGSGSLIGIYSSVNIPYNTMSSLTTILNVDITGDFYAVIDSADYNSGPYILINYPNNPTNCNVAGASGFYYGRYAHCSSSYPCWGSAQPTDVYNSLNVRYTQAYFTLNYSDYIPPEELPTAEADILNVNQVPLLGDLEATTSTISSAFPPFGDVPWYAYKTFNYQNYSLLNFTPALYIANSPATSQFITVDLYENEDFIQSKTYNQADWPEWAEVGIVTFDSLNRDNTLASVFRFMMSATTTAATSTNAYYLTYDSERPPASGGGGGGSWGDDTEWRDNGLCEDPDLETFSGRLWSIVSTKVPFNFFHDIGCAVNESYIATTTTHLAFDVALPAGTIPIDVDFNFLRGILREGFIDVLFKALFIISLTFYFWHRIKSMLNSPLN